MFKCKSSRIRQLDIVRQRVLRRGLHGINSHFNRAYNQTSPGSMLRKFSVDTICSSRLPVKAILNMSATIPVGMFTDLFATERTRRMEGQVSDPLKDMQNYQVKEKKQERKTLLRRTTGGTQIWVRGCGSKYFIASVRHSPCFRHSEITGLHSFE